MEKRGRILVVDDNAMNLDILCRILRKDYELATAENGQECLTKVAEFQPQLVLLDIMMPGMDGYEACHRIKSAAIGEFVQVILVSGKGSPAERLKGYEANADDYIVKPFNHDEMVSKVRVQFRLARAHQELAATKDQLEIYANELERLVAMRTKQLVATQDLAVFTLAELADSHDPETGDHLARMRAYAQILAEQLSESGPYADQIDQRFLENLYRSSPLHDIGKVAISHDILQKPASLTDDEFEEMKKHVIVGAETLEKARDHAGGGGCFLAMAAEIARYHHERFDGTGYCARISGTEIPLAARIVTVADVFDALTSRRVYKLAYEPQVARDIIEQGSGTQFDPVIVEAFGKRFDDLLLAGQQGAGVPNVAQSAYASLQPAFGQSSEWVGDEGAFGFQHAAIASASEAVVEACSPQEA